MFIHIHTHDTKGSLLDSIMTVDQIAQFAADNNQKAIGLTNHGYMSSTVDFVKACNKRNIKPIIGVECYEVDNMFEKSDTKEYVQPRYHLILLAKNQKGYQNLLKITSVACTEGFYKKPLISIDYIIQNKLGEGIICSTACQAGRLSRLLEKNNVDEAYNFVCKLKKAFNYVVCEIQSHNTESQSICNKLIYNFSSEYNLPFVITTDAHMVSSDQLHTHAIFVEIGEGREAGESYTDCYLQNDNDVYETLKSQFSKDIIKQGIQETQKISEMIENIDIGLNKGNIMPEVDIPTEFDSHEKYLRYLVYKTFDEKFNHLSTKDKEIRRERIEIELPILFELKYTDYFIMLYLLAKKADERNIPRGYSRGSGANCLCLYIRIRMLYTILN